MICFLCFFEGGLPFKGSYVECCGILLVGLNKGFQGLLGSHKVVQGHGA